MTTSTANSTEGPYVTGQTFSKCDCDKYGVLLKKDVLLLSLLALETLIVLALIGFIIIWIKYRKIWPRQFRIPMRNRNRTHRPSSFRRQVRNNDYRDNTSQPLPSDNPCSPLLLSPTSPTLYRDIYVASIKESSVQLSTEYPWGDGPLRHLLKVSIDGVEHLLNRLSADGWEDFSEFKRRQQVFGESELRLHPNLLLPTKSIEGRCWLVFGYPKFGTIEQYLTNLPNPGDEKLLDLGKQILNGLRLLHKQSITVGNLNVRSVLVYDEPPHLEQACKLTLFDEAVQRMDDSCVAPECVNRDVHMIDTATDMWAFGVTMCQMFAISKPNHLPADEQPWLSMNLAGSSSNVQRAVRKLPALVRSIIKQCLSRQPSKRPTANDVWLSFQTYEVSLTPRITLRIPDVDKDQILIMNKKKDATSLYFASVQKEALILKKYSDWDEFESRCEIFRTTAISELDVHRGPLLVPYKMVRDHPWLLFLRASSTLHSYWVNLLDGRQRTRFGDRLVEQCRQISHGLSFLHGLSLLVRNLHAGTVLVFDGTEVRLQLCGFDNDCCPINQRCQAPELLLKTSKEPSAPTDIWAFGVTMLQILRIVSGSDDALHVFPTSHMRHLMLRRCAPEFPLIPDLPDSLVVSLRHILMPCFNYTPAQRPTALTLLQQFNSLTAQD